jgi:hypothetical protein
MKFLAEKSLKTELRLKRYMVLKLQGLNYKYTVLDIKQNTKPRARSKLEKNTGALVQVFQDYQGNDLLSKAKPCGPDASVPWNDHRWSTVDSGRRPRGSLDFTSGGISGCQTSRREDQKEEGC